MAALFWSVGLVCVALSEAEIYLPIAASTAILAAVLGYAIWQWKRRRLGALMVLLLVIYLLPFIHIVPYIWFDFEREAPMFMWGVAANPYMLDETIIELTAMLGAIGALGFIAGASLLRGLQPTPSEPLDRSALSVSPLSLPAFSVWVVIAVGLSWIAAPEETVFTTRYSEGTTKSAEWNFAAVWLFSYAVLLFALADAAFDAVSARARTKRQMLLGATLLIVVWFQLLRGDRESLPFAFAALLMYYGWGNGAVGPKFKINWPVLAGVLGLVLVASYFVGVARQSLAGVESLSGVADVVEERREAGAIASDRVLTGTWSAVLLTPLSVAGDHVNGTLELNYGQTYVDLAASAIPGFVADWVGYARPIDARSGPSWQMRYGQGGTHALVVPYMGFGSAGVFGIIALWSLALAAVERRALRELSVSSLALLGIIAMAAPHWLWYGEKAILNAMLLWFGLSVVYKYK